MGTIRPNHKGVSLGRVKAIGRDKIVLALDDTLNQGDGIKFEKSDTGFICNKIYQNGKLVSNAKRGNVIELDAKVSVQVGEVVLKTSDVTLLKSLQVYSEKRISIVAHIKAKKFEPMILTFEDNSGNIASVTGDSVQQSKTRPTTIAELTASISKVGGTPFIINDVTCDCDEDIFVAKSQVNAVRRMAVEKLTKARTEIKKRRISTYAPQPTLFDKKDDTSTLHVLVRNIEQFAAVKNIVPGDVYTTNESLYFNNKCIYKNLRLKMNKLAEKTYPYENERLLVTDNGGIYQYQNDNDIVLDYSLNALNAETVSTFIGMSAKRIAISPELELTQIRDLIKAFEEKNNQNPPMEALVYARHEIMAMKHCVISNDSKAHSKCEMCTKKQYYLVDINRNRYPIITDDYCNNYILGQKIESSDISSLKSLGVRHFRIEFFDENAEQCQLIVKSYIEKINN